MDLEKIDAYNSQLKEEAERKEELSTIVEVGNKVKKAVEYSTVKLISDKRVNPQKVNIINDIATARDMSKVISALDRLAVVLKPEKNDDTNVVSAMDKVYTAIKDIPRFMPETPEPVEDVTITNITEIQKYIKPLIDAINKLELNPIFDPRIEVKPADVKIATEKVDTEPLLRALESVAKEVTKLTLKEQPETNLSPLVEATRATTKAINNLQFPVPNYILPFKDISGKAVQVQLDASGNVPTSSSGGATTWGISDIEATATYKYFGFQKSDSGWYIMRKTIATKKFEYVAGASAYSTAWTNRASQTYTDYATAF